MGMDYKFAGSSSYSRFEDEIREVVKLFYGISLVELPDDTDKVFYPFGYINYISDSSDKFEFPQGTNEAVIKWLNHPYDERTPDETKCIWDAVKGFGDKVPVKIYCELKSLVECGMGWDISQVKQISFLIVKGIDC